MESDYLTVKDVAKKLDVSGYTVRYYLNKGELKGIKIGGWRIKPNDLEAFIISRTNVREEKNEESI